MLILVTGGSGSGKSEYAENLAVEVRDENYPLFYIATMIPYDEETLKKIKRHKEMRKEKDFHTIECYMDLDQIKIKAHGTVLLECMSNLFANELYQKGENASNPVACVTKVMQGIRYLTEVSEHVIVVSNEVFSDGIEYDLETKEYMKALGAINRGIAAIADQVIEVVYSIPVYAFRKDN